MDGVVDLVDATVDGLSILVEWCDLLDKLCAASALAVNNLVLRSDSLREIAIIAFNGQHAARQIRNLILLLTSRLWAR